VDGIVDLAPARRFGPLRLGARERQTIERLARAAAHLPRYGRDLDIGHAALLLGYVDAMTALSAEFQGLIEKPAFVGGIPQRGEAERGVGPLLGDLDPGARNKSPLARRSQIEILFVSQIERSLQGEPRAALRLLCLGRGCRDRQDQKERWKRLHSPVSSAPVGRVRIRLALKSTHQASYDKARVASRPFLRAFPISDRCDGIIP